MRCLRAVALYHFVSICVCSCSASNPLSFNTQKAGSTSSDDEYKTPPFEPLPLEAQASKVKLLLTGEAVSEADYNVVLKEGMQSAIVEWQKRPGAQEKMLALLSASLQQSAPEFDDFFPLGFFIDAGTIGSQAPLLMQNLRESMARTVLAGDAAGMPFGQSAMATHTFMMTPPMEAYYACLDAIAMNDNGGRTNVVSDDQYRSIMSAFKADDYNNWRMVTIRQPNGQEATTSAFNSNFAGTTTLVLKTPRQGFMTTPAFLATWGTNTANQARVTINQALIVALGASFDGADATTPVSLQALDTAHAAPSTPCYTCHVNLDPMRQIYRQFYSLHFGPQTDTKQTSLPGQFAFGGVSRQLSSAEDFGNILATHPAMPLAWTRKVCAWANNTSCVADDPEIVRIANQFAQDGSFTKMVANVLSSPLTTYAKETKTTKQNGVTFAINKQEHLCPLLSQRLGIADVCGLALNATPTDAMQIVQNIAIVIPSNAYSRGQPEATQANDPGLFFRSGAENMCVQLAAKVVDASNNKSFVSSAPDASIANLVHQLMGIPALSGRDGEPISILTQHYQAAVAQGATPAVALQSTFVLACLSPSVMGTAQ